MDHDHDHRHHEDIVVTQGTKLMNHSENLMQQRISPSLQHSGHVSHTKDMMMMMAMTFHGGVQEQILFDQWKTESVSAFIGSWFLIFFVAILYEGLKTIRDHLAKHEARQHYAEKRDRQAGLIARADQPHEPPNYSETIPGIRTNNTHSRTARLLSGYHITQTLLHVVQMGISYLLMLIAMTFNIYLFLAIILGAGLGHFLFGWRRSSIIDYNDHCH